MPIQNMLNYIKTNLEHRIYAYCHTMQFQYLLFTSWFKAGHPHINGTQGLEKETLGLRLCSQLFDADSMVSSDVHEWGLLLWSPFGTKELVLSDVQLFSLFVDLASWSGDPEASLQSFLSWFETCQALLFLEIICNSSFFCQVWNELTRRPLEDLLNIPVLSLQLVPTMSM
jgi:hypothetical protein